MTTKAEKAHRYFNRMAQIGVSYSDAAHLRRIEMTLRRWYELECGDGNDHASWAIERDPETGKPYMSIHPHTGKSYRRPIADRETGALRRAGCIAGKYGLTIRHQTDPRGGALYVALPADGREVYCNY
jgi:hypothetical protein